MYKCVCVCLRSLVCCLRIYSMSVFISFSPLSSKSVCALYFDLATMAINKSFPSPVCTKQRAWTNQAALILFSFKFIRRLFISGYCCCAGTFLIQFYCHYRLNITFFFHHLFRCCCCFVFLVYFEFHLKHSHTTRL